MALEVVREQPAPPSADQTTLAKMVASMLSMASLAQRFTIAVSNLFAMLALASVFVLFMAIPNPNTFQLISLGGYAGFILIALYIVRRRE